MRQRRDSEKEQTLLEFEVLLNVSLVFLKDGT